MSMIKLVFQVSAHHFFNSIFLPIFHLLFQHSFQSMLGFPIPLAQGVINHLPSLWVEWQHICHPCPVSMTQMTHICLFPSPLCYIKCELFVSYFPLLQLYFGVFVAAAVFHYAWQSCSFDCLVDTDVQQFIQATYLFFLSGYRIK